MKKTTTFIILLVFSISCFSQGAGKSYNPNGTSNHIDLGVSVSTNVRTIEVWFRAAQNIDQFINKNQSLLVRNSSSQTNEYGLYFIGTGSSNKGKLNFFFNTGSTTYSVLSDENSWSAQQWYHIAATIDATNGMELYVNGVLQADTETGYTSAIPSSTDPLSVASWGDSLTDYLSMGQIDEIRLWTTTRTQTELRDNMCKKLAGTETGLQGYYRCDDGTGTTLTDLTSNNYDGTLNAAAWATSSAPIGDESSHNFPSGSWNGETISIAGSGDVFTINSVQHGVAPAGGHVYRVDAVPNNTTSITGLGNNAHYFGVYIPGGSGVNYSIEYDYATNGDVCSTCADDAKLFTRNDNSIPGWFSLAATNDDVNRVFTKSGESTTGAINRAEYILGSTGAPLNVDHTNKNEIAFYPNPATNSFTINSKTVGKSAIETISGNVVQNFQLKEGNNEFSVSNLPKGIYLLKTEIDKQVSYSKIIIE